MLLLYYSKGVNKMKTIKKSVSIMLSALILISIFTVIPITANANAEDDYYTSGDYKYTVLEDGTAKITEYIGSAAEVNIPSELDGKKVTVIGFYAFNFCESLTSVNIPDSVTGIDLFAFSNCKSLSNVNIPDSVTSIGNSAFFGCGALTSIYIPDGVTSISSEAFMGCKNLKNIFVDKNNKKYCSINGNLYNKEKTVLIWYAIGKTETSFTIPDGVTKIGDNAFSCFNSKLKSVIISDSVTTIGNSAFFECTSLSSIKIGKGVKIICDSAFCDCWGLNSIIIPNGVTYIGKHVFYDCKKIKSITLPKSVMYIGYEAIGYYEEYSSEKDYYTNKIDGFTIYGTKGTKAEEYAEKNGFTFVEKKKLLMLM